MLEENQTMDTSETQQAVIASTSQLNYVPASEQRRVFDTPLSNQRYEWIRDFARTRPDITRISDFGCYNGRIVRWLKEVPHLAEINFIDIDEVVLREQWSYHIQPCLIEGCFGRPGADVHLSLKIYHGDVAIPDDRLAADLFLMVELIEHMTLNHLERSVKTVFGYYQPKYVIVTTPNLEFNHLLNRNPSDGLKFRHHDHKFEWTRAQFVNWAEIICSNYPYICEFDGVGHLLPESAPFGPCTQLVVFTLDPKRQLSKEDRDLAAFDSFLDKLNLTEFKYDNEVDRDVPKITFLREFNLKPGMPLPPGNYEPIDWDNLE